LVGGGGLSLYPRPARKSGIASGVKLLSQRPELTGRAIACTGERVAGTGYCRWDVWFRRRIRCGSNAEGRSVATVGCGRRHGSKLCDPHCALSRMSASFGVVRRTVASPPGNGGMDLSHRVDVGTVPGVVAWVRPERGTGLASAAVRRVGALHFENVERARPTPCWGCVPMDACFQIG